MGLYSLTSNGNGLSKVNHPGKHDCVQQTRLEILHIYTLTETLALVCASTKSAPIRRAKEPWRPPHGGVPWVVEH
eukprot:scaffold185214_cov17-Tisochrysis_lutea.AAC.1